MWGLGLRLKVWGLCAVVLCCALRLCKGFMGVKRVYEG